MPISIYLLVGRAGRANVPTIIKVRVALETTIVAHADGLSVATVGGLHSAA